MIRLFSMISACAVCLISPASADIYQSIQGQITVISATGTGGFTAVSTAPASQFNTDTGEVAFSTTFSSFTFDNSLLAEYFNEDYVESSSDPKSPFQGQLDNIGDIDFSTDGTYESNLSGDFTLYGIEKPVKSKVNITVSEGNISATTTFTVAVADYGIKIPRVVRDNIAKEVEIVVDMDYKPFNK